MKGRYEIRPIVNPNGKFGVWDREIGIWQTAKPTRKAAKEFINQQNARDAKPRSWAGVRMPVKD